MSGTFLDRVPPFKHKVTREVKREILQYRAKRTNQNPTPQPPIIKLPLPEKIEDDKKVEIAFSVSKEIEDKITEYALELDDYQVQSWARAQDYIRSFMRANALLNDRKRVTTSDLYLYDLVHPLFLNGMGELGTENRILSLFKEHPDAADRELIGKSGVSKGTFYRYKKILLGKGLI
jgi:hypothetical protein